MLPSRLLPCVCIAVTILAACRASAQEMRFRTLAGTTTGGGYADGTGPTAKFSSPSGVTACGGFLFVADHGNHAIRRVTPGGEVTTWAGALTVEGSIDGRREQARFRLPGGIAADNQCNLYVADTGNHTIRRVSVDGQVTTIAGKAGEAGIAHGRGTEARFNGPTDLVVSGDGTIYVTDTGNHVIRRIASDGRVIVYAGTPGARGFVDGIGASVRFDFPLGLDVDSAGNVFVFDMQNQRIRRIEPSGLVSSVNKTLFFGSDVVVGCDGTLYATDRFGHRVVAVKPDGTVSALAGINTEFGFADGEGPSARFERPRAIELDGDCSLVVVDEADGIVRRVTTNGTVTTLAGAAAQRAHVDGAREDARFRITADIDVDPAGVAYVVDGATVRRVAPDGTVSTLAGSSTERVHRDGSGSDARFTAVGRIAVDPTGGLVVTDGPVIRRVSLSGEVTTIAGAPGQEGYREGSGSEARFQTPLDLAVGNDGTIYVTDPLNEAIRKIVGTTVSTLHRDTALGVPRGIDVDAEGNVFFWDENVPSVFKLTPAGQRTTVFHDDSLFALFEGLALGPDGSIYVGGFRVHSIRKLTSDGRLETFAGAEQSPGNQNGALLAARFRSPGRFAFASDGRMYVVDSNAAVRIGEVNAPPTIVRFASTPHEDGSATLSWESMGGLSARIDPEVGSVALNGSVTVHPAAYTRYTLTVTGEGGVTTAQVGVGEAQRRRPARR